VQIGILGPLEVRDDGAGVPIAGARLRRLLTRLAIDAGRAVPIAELVDAVWLDDPPNEVANALQSLVSRLRRALGDPTLIQQTPAGYRLQVPRTDVDGHAFTDLAAAGRRELAAGDPAAAARTLSSALQLWRGAPLGDADDAPYAAAPIARWDETRLTVCADRIAAELALGNASGVIPELEELVAANPLREQFVGQLMTALAATGRTADALAAYQQLRDRLADLLGADPGAEVSAQHLALLRGEQPATLGTSSPATTPPVGRRTNLRAAVSSFIGREAELARIAELVDQGRLTTIVGPGGAGKTRLATEAASPLVDGSRDGVWLVELAPVDDGATIAQAVLGAFGVRDARILDRRAEPVGSMSAGDRVLDTLVDSDALLVIDNCEHLIGAVAEFVELLLARCPRVRVLATSREPLGLAGEALVAIPPLGLPPIGAGTEQASDYPAVRLLVERGRAGNATFRLTDETVGPVVDIVRRLDGLPLAIELAAARLRVLPVTEIAERLTDRFRLLAGGMRTSVARHRTLRAVVEWSWELLTDGERLLAERLAIFPAGTTTAVAVQVCADDALDALDVPDLLLALVDKSLLQVASGPGAVRYRMLETIREYGVERLDERGELAAARTRHATYFADRARQLDPVLRTREQLTALAEFTAERDNMLAALRYLGDSGDVAVAAEMVLDLCWYWTITGAHTEMATWTQFVLDVGDETDSPDRARVRASRLLARIFGAQTNPQESWSGLPQELAAVGSRLAEIDDGTEPMTVLARLYIGYFGRHELDGEQLVERGPDTADPWMRAVVRAMRAMYLENNGDVAGLRDEIDATYAAFDEIGDRWGLSTVLTVRAGVRSMDGDVDGAVADYQRALDYLDQLGATEDDMIVHLKMAGLRVRQNDFEGARAHIHAVRTGQPGTPVPMERILLADAAQIGILVMQGDVAQAVERATDLRARVPGAVGNNPMYGHLRAMIGSVCASAAVAGGDLPTAHRDLLAGYPAALSTEDRPLMAAFGVAVATYAEAIGRPVDGAEILGAATALRGADDLGDAGIARVREQLILVLGQAVFDAEDAAGRSLGHDIAAKRLDPALLDEDQAGAPFRAGARAAQRGS
jgi:predicted ATPase/DNA-binding SARP family transcriptional activator